MELILGAAGIAVALTLAVMAIGLQAEERATVRTSLRRLEGYDLQNTRDQEMLAPLRTRAIAPAGKWVVGIGRRFTPVGYVEKVKKKLVQAGKPEPAELDRFLVKKVIGVVLVPVAFLVVYALLDLSGLMSLTMFGLLAAILVLGPDAILAREAEERQHAVRIALPDILDLLVISVEAGLGFEQALDRCVDAVPGPLTDEFNRMLGEVRAGASRSEAMRSLEARLDVPEVRSFILAMLQADTFGVSIGRVLRAQADEMRVKRRQLAQERAQKAPVKMLVPMVFCIFPALFVVIIGPAMINIYREFV